MGDAPWLAETDMGKLSSNLSLRLNPFNDGVVYIIILSINRIVSKYHRMTLKNSSSNLKSNFSLRNKNITLD